MIWVLQKNLINEVHVNEVIYVLDENEIPFETLSVIPFSDDIEVKSNDPVKIPYGSTRLSMYAYRNNWKGMFFNENFKTSVWLDHRDDMLNNDVVILSLKEARNFMKHFKECEWFVRPDNDLKEFSGECMMTSQFNELMDKLSGANGNLLNENTRIVIAPSQEIGVEYRWFIVNGEVINGSLYRVNRRLLKNHVDDPLKIKHAQRLADKWLPHETCVMDTTRDKVIEFNCLNASGFYDHDIEKIILSITNYVKEKYNE